MTFGFLNHDAISDQKMQFFILLYALLVPLITIPDFRLRIKILSVFDQKGSKKPSLWGCTFPI